MPIGSDNARETLVKAPQRERERDVYYYMCWRLKLEGETENMGVCTKERKSVTAEVLMATPEERKVGFIENTAMRHRRGG